MEEWMMSGQSVMDAACEGKLVAVLKRPWGEAIASVLVARVLMPYCRWPVSVKRRPTDDFDEWEVCNDRDQLLSWNLFHRQRTSKLWVASFQGFFSPLEICIHLAQAELQSRTREEECKSFSRLRIASDQVQMITIFLRRIIKDHEKTLRIRYGNDLVRLLLDLFLPFSQQAAFSLAPYLLVRRDEIEIFNRLYSELIPPYFAPDVMLNAAGKGSLYQPEFTISHPEFSSPPPPSKKSKTSPTTIK